jgi:hypothetical protein
MFGESRTRDHMANMTDKPAPSAFHYPQLARSLGPRQMPKAAETFAQPRPAPAATQQPPKADLPADGDTVPQETTVHQQSATERR